MLLVGAGAAVLSAQARARHFEFGAFGAFTRYDKAFALDEALGGGARFGYFFTNQVSLEVDILFQSQQEIPGSPGRFEPLVGGGSVVYNLPVAGLATLFVLGGYSRLDFGTVSPYRFTDGGVHGGAGVRLRVGERAALRFEGRYIYTPETQGSFGTKSVQHLMATAGFSVFHSDAPPRAAPPTPAPPVVAAAPAPGDGDADGVTDDLDECPDTPAGATVDVRGCPSDSDGDRVLDGLDRCPDTPPGATVNALGCPSDEDADNVADGVDQCPGTPLGALVDPRGCPTDSDGDTVFDGIDQCPNTAAGAAVDARGCTTQVVQAVEAPKDTDRDGVTDDVDRCPNTPPGSQVDQVGCMILFREPAGEKATPLVLRGVNFATGRSILTRESLGVLDEVAASLVANPDVRIEIAGHTDNTGSDALNLRLSQARAAAVRHYLVSKGVALDRMTARGYGESEPVADNTTPQGRAENRRVELRRSN
ncbi:MAG: OmpA family protein [Gemmatimonadales bacterium]